MPPEPSVTSACEGPRLCTLRYSSALLPKSFERPGPKSVSPATYCSGVEVVVSWRWIVDMRAPYRGGVTQDFPIGLGLSCEFITNSQGLDFLYCASSSFQVLVCPLTGHVAPRT